jgi:hypothetical protein
MQKIISLFQRNYDGDHLVRNEVVPGAEWVLAGEGVATQKVDGSCCLVRDGMLFRRYEIKPGGKSPEHFEAVAGDPVTGKIQGWVAVGQSADDRWHRAAWEDLDNTGGQPLADGTYELCGPKVNGNPEGFGGHHLIGHGCIRLLDCPRTFDEIKAYLAPLDIEGIVWHHPDGRMVKIKKKDFGLKLKPAAP